MPSAWHSGLAAVALTVAFAGCTTSAGGEHGTIPGTLRVAVATNPNTLNPLFITSTAESLIVTLVFDGLTYALPDGTIEPVLATEVPTVANGGISRDGRTITYHLRHGVRWHDGAPFTSADVAFTQAATMNPTNNVVVRQPADRVVRLDTPDAYTVVVHLKRLFAPFVANWLQQVLPAHLLAGKRELNDDSFNSAPIGTGAFRFVRWDRGNAITFDANRTYFQGQPGLRHLIIQYISDDNASALALRTHAVDWLYQPSAQQAALLETAPDVRIEKFDVNEQDDIYINTTRPPLDDLRVRRALSLGIDRVTLAAKLGHGFVVPATADIPSYMWAYDSSLRAPYDPRRARALLAAAGWAPGPDGVRARRGKRLALTYLYASGRPIETGYAVQIAAELRAIGVELVLKGLTSSTFYAIDGPGYGGDFDLAYAPFYWNPDPDDTQTLSCSTVAPHGNNWSRWCNAEWERWNEIALSHDDRATRRAAYFHMQRLILDQAPELILDHRIDAEAVTVDLHGFRDHDTYSQAYRWSISSGS